MALHIGPAAITLAKVEADHEPKYPRMTGKSLRTHLAGSLGISDTALPSRRTLRGVLNPNGYELKRWRKTLPQRIIKQTEAIFENVLIQRLFSSRLSKKRSPLQAFLFQKAIEKRPKIVYTKWLLLNIVRSNPEMIRSVIETKK